MVTMIVFTVTAFVASMYLLRGSLDRVFQSLMLGVAGAAIDLLIAAIFMVVLPKVPRELPPQALYSLSDGSQVSGRFFLGSGSFEGKQVIFYSKKDPNTGMITFHHLSKEAVGIMEDNPETPYLQSWEAAYAWGSWVDYFTLGCPSSDLGKIPVFHIPAGSVKQGYTIE